MSPEMSPERIRNIVEAALLAAGRPLSLDVLTGLFQPAGVAAEPDEGEAQEAVVGAAPAAGIPGRDDVRAALEALAADYQVRGIELREVSSGYRIQVRSDHAEALRPLWSERPARYSRALLETLALIAYRQPITRGEIEDIRGVSVSSSIVKTLLEREWVRVVGHRDVPGKPAMYGTTRQFLDYFSLKSLAELPTLAEIRDIDEISGELFPDEVPPEVAAQTGGDDSVGRQERGEAAGGDEHSEADQQATQEAAREEALAPVLEATRQESQEEARVEAPENAGQSPSETEPHAVPEEKTAAELEAEEDLATVARIMAPES